MTSHTPTHDRQLWRIVDSVDGKECCWPCYVTPSMCPHGECYFVEPACVIDNRKQHHFVDTRLKAISFDHEGTRYLVRKTFLEQSLFKCEGITPSYYLKWESNSESVTPKEIRAAEKEEQSIDDDYVRWVCNRAGFMDLPSARLLFNLFCSGAMPWMLERHKTLNLGFAKIMAFPYRKNVFSILHQKHRNILGTLRRQKKIRDSALEAVGFTGDLFSSDNIAMDSETNTHGWSLFITEEKPFHKATDAMEAATFQSTSEPGRYVSRWVRFVEKHTDRIIYAFKSYLEAASHPVASVLQTGGRIHWRMVPRLAKNRVRPPVPEPPRDNIQSAIPVSPDDPPTEGELSVEQAGDL